jgi:CheY-like chemotaxis protein
MSTASTPSAEIRALIVDDNQINRLVLSAMLEKMGIGCDQAVDGAAALNAVEQRGDYALIFMDFFMPGIDGAEATRRIRALGGHWETVPIIGLTASELAEDNARCLEAGMSAMLPKPYTPQQMADAVAAQLTG